MHKYSYNVLDLTFQYYAKTIKGLIKILIFSKYELLRTNMQNKKIWLNIFSERLYVFVRGLVL